MSIAVNAFLNEAGAEVLKSVRAPEFLLPTLVMPVAFYTLFAVILPGAGAQAAYMLATFGVFAVMGPAIFGFGVSVAAEREKGWLDLKRAAPAPAASYIGAKLSAILVFSAIALAVLYSVAGFVAGVELPRLIWLALLGTHLLAAIPFALIGLTLGFLMNSNGAVAVSNIVFLALSALGGLWIPIFLFPEFMQSAARLLPSYQLGELALGVSGAPGDHDVISALITTAFMTFILCVLTVFAWSRQKS